MENSAENNNDRRGKIEAEIRRVEEALRKTKSQYQKNDYGKYLRRMKKALEATLALILALVLQVGAAQAGETEQMWVLCNPESYVCIREAPKKNAHVGGYLYFGDSVETDGLTKGDWIHVVNASVELGEGWVHKGYLGWSEPQEINLPAKVLKKQTRARGCIEGQVKNTLKKGTVVTVYAENLQWSVTSVGYIKTELLEVQRE
ncbi:MAG: SH3 domain-containing protein [Clostridia bacterium]|nr:SH3 domain-containing protein [Clostridia bacterium]